MKSQKGFTLIELIVVIVVVGILAATAMPKFYDLILQAKIAKTQAQLGAMRDVIKMQSAVNIINHGEPMYLNICPPNADAYDPSESATATCKLNSTAYYEKISTPPVNALASSGGGTVFALETLVELSPGVYYTQTITEDYLKQKGDQGVGWVYDCTTGRVWATIKSGLFDTNRANPISW